MLEFGVKVIQFFLKKKKFMSSLLSKIIIKLVFHMFENHS